MSSLEAQVNELKGIYQHLATKADVEALRADMNERFASVNERLGSLESRLLRWMVGMTLNLHHRPRLRRHGHHQRPERRHLIISAIFRH